MTRLQVTTAFVFFLFTLSSARSPLLRPINDAKPAAPITDPSASDHNRIDLLHPQPADPTNPINILTDSDRSSLPPPPPPFKILRFRAVNRHFRPYTLRIRKIRRCQHEMIKPLNLSMIDPRFKYRRGAVSFGHDIIFVVGKNRLEEIRDQKLKRGSAFLKGFRKFLNQYLF